MDCYEAKELKINNVLVFDAILTGNNNKLTFKEGGFIKVRVNKIIDSNYFN